MGTSISVPEDVEARLRRNGPRKELLASDRANPTRSRLKDNMRTLNVQLPLKNRTKKSCAADEQLNDECYQAQVIDERERRITFQVKAGESKEEIPNLKIQEEKQVEVLPIHSLSPINQQSKAIIQPQIVVHGKQVSSIIEKFYSDHRSSSLVPQLLKPKNNVKSSHCQEKLNFYGKEAISTCQTFLPSKNKENSQMASIKQSLKPIKLKRLLETQEIKPEPKIVRLRLY